MTGTGLDDFDGHMLAHALHKTPPHDTEQGSSKLDKLDLTQIVFDPNVRTRLMEAGEKAGVRVCLRSPNGLALRGLH